MFYLSVLTAISRVTNIVITVSVENPLSQFAFYVKHVEVERRVNDRIQISAVGSCSFV